ncbi:MULTISPECIES: PL29 family lyase N-terminal domain-containing protein [Bacteroides]|uniref:PL29 family lyase N-terminal domain-containing protein n=1 Tax=Bacteroides TaxID=816 RepID=UPI00189CF056|nr:MULTISPECIES: PL29 family lyase N-terminal domain-containing protein [Bacteroides]MDC2613664.1 PL29 family lyase N-terminal domain-containing protein [Bacteroides ovatus]MDC2633027.1 PL29 family lyase N-terminal domain-containing protein [Bacteroides ovatus]
MKKFRHYALLLVMVMAVFGCSKDYDDTAIKNDISDLQSRVEKLETWCTTVNSQISALQVLVTALEANDYVTGVSLTSDGYTITFSKSETITINNGKDGDKGADGVTPVIGVDKFEGEYYWTVKIGTADATWMLDANNNKIRTTGDKGADGSAGVAGTSPVLSVATDTDGKVYWKVNGEWMLNDDGKKVQATGDKGDKGATGSAGAAGADGAQGDAVFAADGVTVDKTKGTVTFTLAGEDGATFTLPMASEMKIFDSFTTFIAKANKNLTLALNIKKGSYTAIKAEITNNCGTGIDFVKPAATRVATTAWSVTLTEPTFKTDGTIDANGTVAFQFPAGITDGEFALLKVTVIDTNGQEHAATRIIEYSSEIDLISISLTDQTVSEGEKVTLAPTFNPTNASNKNVTWSSSNTAVATVNANTGEVEGKTAGTATITATSVADSSIKATCVINVTSGPTFENEGTPGIDGSSWEKAYTIKTKKQLALLATRVKKENSKWGSKFYKMIADIDLGATNTEAWTPIGGNGFEFNGHFDGGNFTVGGKLIADVLESHFGIFGLSGRDSEIKNLNFSGTMDATSATSLSVAGSIIGLARGDIMHCSNSGNLTTVEGKLGGIAGANAKPCIACSNSGRLQGNDQVFGVSNSAIGCKNTAASISGKSYVGGISGFNDVVIACWSSTTTITGSYPGAIIGFAAAGTTGCYWKEASGLKGCFGGPMTNSGSFTSNTPTADQIAAMNAAWEVAQPTGREYKFDANGDIVKL